MTTKKLHAVFLNGVRRACFAINMISKFSGAVTKQKVNFIQEENNRRHDEINGFTLRN